MQDDDELMGKDPTTPPTGVAQTASASTADPSSLAKTGVPQAVKVEKGVERKDAARKPKVVKFETEAEEVEHKVDPSGDTIMGGEASKADGPVAAKEEVLENKPKPKARPIQKSRDNPGVPEPTAAGRYERSGNAFWTSACSELSCEGSRADSQRNGANVGSRVV